jgi:hypothetical protein
MKEPETMQEVMQQQEQLESARSARTFIANARNAMFAIRTAIEDGDDDEALRLIAEALGED